MTKIKFGTDGWRAIIAQEFTTENVARVAEGTAKWLTSTLSHGRGGDGREAAVVIGHDCRFAGELFAGIAAKVLAHYGIKVYLAKGAISRYSRSKERVREAD